MTDEAEMPVTGGETQVGVLYRVSGKMLATMQQELPKQGDGQIHFRQAVGALAVSLGRWLALMDENLSAEATVEGVFESVRKLMVATLEGERERLADEAAEKAKGQN